MKSKIKVIISVVLFVVMISIVASGYLILSQNRENEELQNEYSIIVDDNITVYAGDTYTLVPYLIRKDGTVEESRFQYTPSTNDIVVSDDGIVSVQSVPAANEEVKITIFERNTSVSAEVGVNVVSQLSNVLGITFSDAEGHKSLVNGTQELQFGEEYILEFVTEPKNVNIGDYCEIIAIDSNAQSKDVFNVKFNKASANISVVGLGAGTLKLQVLDDNKLEIYTLEFNFSIQMLDAELGQQILNSSKQTLLSQEDISKIDRIIINDQVSDLASLEYFDSLETVVVNSNTIPEYANLSDKYCYRVKENLFYEYYENEWWRPYAESIIPYSTDSDETYVVYHSDKSTELSFSKIESGFSLQTLIARGYINSAWLTSSGDSAADLDIYSFKNGIHLFAQWTPINYTVEYHIRAAEPEIVKTEAWNFETYSSLKIAEDYSITLLGYKFIGWTLDSTGTIYDDDPDKFERDVFYKELTDQADAVIALYDIWAPIEYIIRFIVPSDAKAINDATVKYDMDYTLPSAEREGWTFTLWTLPDGAEKKANDVAHNLATEDGEIVEIESSFSENKYTLHFNLNGGTPSNGANTNPVSRKYTESYTLPQLERQGFTSYLWVYDRNGNGVADSNEQSFTSVQHIRISDVKNIVGDEIHFIAKWTSSSYTIYFNANGGSFVDAGFSARQNRTYDSEPMSFPSVTRTGYTLASWLRRDTNISYDPSEKLPGSLTSENGIEITFTAQWREHTYSISFNSNGGSSVSSINDVSYTTNVTLPNAPSKTGNTFNGWNINGTSYAAGEKVSKLTSTDKGQVTAIAEWTQIIYNVTTENGTNGNHITISFDNSNTYTYGSTVKFTLTIDSGYTSGYYELNCGEYGVDSTNSGWSSRKLTAEFTMPAGNVTIKLSCQKEPDSCLVAGTPISLFNGKTVLIEDIKMGDRILAYDHETGQYVASTVVYTFFSIGNVNIIDLHFNNGINIKLANGGHGLFDVTLNKYVLITAENASEYIGHEFSYALYDGKQYVSERIRLETVNITIENVERYDIVTENTLNHLANGILACSDTLVGICNMFEFMDDMTYDMIQLQKDIETYGLFTYEEWQDFVSYEDFIAFNGAYFKIAIGKGLLTEEEIFELINDLLTWSR